MLIIKCCKMCNVRARVPKSHLIPEAQTQIQPESHFGSTIQALVLFPFVSMFRFCNRKNFFSFYYFFPKKLKKF